MSRLYDYKVAIRHLQRLAAADLRMLGAEARRAKHVAFRRADGLQMRIRTNDRVGHRMMREQDFEPGIRDYIASHHLSGAVVVDVGANIGYFTLQFANLVGPTGRVIAFEPTARAFAELLANVETNDLRNTECRRLALSDRCGSAVIVMPGEGAEAYASLIDAEARTGMRETVECRSFDTVWKEMGEPRISLVKMDVEGAERLVLNGAGDILAAHAVGEWIFEANEVRLNLNGECVWDTLSLLAGFGYVLRQLAEDYWSARLPAWKPKVDLPNLV